MAEPHHADLKLFLIPEMRAVVTVVVHVAVQKTVIGGIVVVTVTYHILKVTIIE